MLAFDVFGAGERERVRERERRIYIYIHTYIHIYIYICIYIYIYLPLRTTPSYAYVHPSIDIGMYMSSPLAAEVQSPWVDDNQLNHTYARVKYSQFTRVSTTAKQRKPEKGNLLLLPANPLVTHKLSSVRPIVQVNILINSLGEFPNG